MTIDDIDEAAIAMAADEVLHLQRELRGAQSRLDDAREFLRSLLPDPDVNSPWIRHVTAAGIRVTRSRVETTRLDSKALREHDYETWEAYSHTTISERLIVDLDKEA